jgi:hypothetical protein
MAGNRCGNGRRGIDLRLARNLSPDAKVLFALQRLVFFWQSR